MRNKNNIVSIGIIGIIVIALSLAVFFLSGVEKITINILALMFLLLSEFVLFGGLIGLRLNGANHGKVFLNAGIGTTLILYFLATLISTLFTGAFIEKLNRFILIEVVIIALSAIVMILVFASSRGIERSNEKDMSKVGNIKPKRGGF